MVVVTLDNPSARPAAKFGELIVVIILWIPSCKKTVLYKPTPGIVMAIKRQNYVGLHGACSFIYY